MENNLEQLSRGAEAIIYKTKNNTLVKVRDSKTYRNPLLDKKLRTFRTKREYKILTTLYEHHCNVPKPIHLDTKTTSIEFEYISGEILKQCLTQELLDKAFNQIISMHKQGIVHLDLTTLNMIYSKDDIYIIDFGLSEFSIDKEKRAIDLFLFFSCLHNEHQDLEVNETKLLEKYETEIENGSEVLKQLEKIKLRGRNKNKQ
jgi:TP53 regulating kinase-like protein